MRVSVTTAQPARVPHPEPQHSGWTADSIQIMHGIHGADKRTVDYKWHATCRPPRRRSMSAEASGNRVSGRPRALRTVHVRVV